MKKMLMSLALMFTVSLSALADVRDHRDHNDPWNNNSNVRGLEQLLSSIGQLQDRAEDLARYGARDNYELDAIKRDLQQATRQVDRSIYNLSLGYGGGREIRHDINLSQGPYAPSCNGNPAFPQPDQRCCQFGPQALCFSYNVGCGPGETFVRAEVSCQGYVRGSLALEVGQLGDQGRQLACEKLDGRPGNVQLVGQVVCRARR